LQFARRHIPDNGLFLYLYLADCKCDDDMTGKLQTLYEACGTVSKILRNIMRKYTEVKSYKGMATLALVY